MKFERALCFLQSHRNDDANSGFSLDLENLKKSQYFGKPGHILEFCDCNTPWQNGIKPRKNGHSDVWHFALGVTLIYINWLERKPLPWYSSEKYSMCSNEILSLQILVWKNMEVTLEIMKKIPGNSLEKFWRNTGMLEFCQSRKVKGDMLTFRHWNLIVCPLFTGTSLTWTQAKYRLSCQNQPRARWSPQESVWPETCLCSPWTLAVR